MAISDTTEHPRGFRLKGWHVLSIFVGAFAVIITVNVFMATQAVRTFPGLEVANSYVASQEFDTRRASQQALGWTVYADEAGGMVRIAITGADGAPVRARDLTAVIGRTTMAADDMTPQFAWTGTAYEAPVSLTGGKWIVRLEAVAEDGTPFLQRIDLHVQR